MTPQSLSPPQTRDQAIQCIDDSVFQLQSPTAKPSFSAKASLTAKASYSAEPSPTSKSSPTTKSSLSAKSSNSSNVSCAATSIDTDSKHRVHLVTIHNDGTETHEYVNDDPEPLDEASQYESSESQTISIDELMKLGVTLDDKLELLAICDNGSEVYSVLNIDKSKMICTLTRHPDRTIDITTRDGQEFKLLQSVASVTSTVSPPKTSTQTSLCTPHINASQQCIWCDNFGHYYSTCQEFHEAIRCRHIYLSKTNRILSTRSGDELPLAIGYGGMKAYL